MAAAWLLTAALVLVAGLLSGTPAAGQGSPEGLELRRDVPYGVASGQTLTMDAYIPSGSGPFPGLITIHGGGFVRGDKSLMRGVSMFFAQQGYAVFSIDYRLAPEFPYPAAVRDAQTAVKFIRDHAGEFKVDPGRIGAMGGSAGATIAVQLGEESRGHLASGSGVVAVVSWSAALDLGAVIGERAGNRAVDDLLSYAGVPGANPSSAGTQAKLKAASPVNQLARGAPPMFIANAQQELMPIDQAQAFVAKLKALGIPHQSLWPPKGHALKYAPEAEAPSAQFLDKYVRDPKTSPSPSASPSPSVTPSPEPTSPPSRSSLLLPIVIGVGLVVLAGLLAGPVISAVRRRRRTRYW
jgi:acetyl esterase